MAVSVDFQVGEKYSNRLGSYTVQSIHGDHMGVEYADGAKQTLTIAIQEKVVTHLAQENVITEHTIRREDLFYRAVGNLLATKFRIIAFVPTHAVDSFKSTCLRLTDQQLDSPGITLHPPGTNKRWYELRITFPEDVTNILCFGSEATIVRSTREWYINNNALIQKLLRLGFRFGGYQDVKRIEGRVPEVHRAAFQFGLRG